MQWGDVVIRPRSDVLPVRRVRNGLHRVSMPFERIADCITSLGNPDSNGAVAGSGDEVPPIGRVSKGVGMPLERIAYCCTGIPRKGGSSSPKMRTYDEHC